MESRGYQSLFLIAALTLSLSGQDILAPQQILSGQAALVVIQSAPLDAENLRLVHQGGSLMSRIPVFHPQKEAESDWGVWILGALSTWAPGTYYLEMGEQRRSIEILPREYIRETIPLNSDLTGIRTDDSQLRQEQSKELSELLLSWDPDFPTYQGSWIMPIQQSYRESSFFGDRRTYRYSDGSTASSIHNGWDHAVETGTPIFSPATAQVMMAKDRIVTGNTVVLQVMPGVYVLFYHLDELAVEVGDWVLKSQILGTVGSTGLATGPHLHYEIRVNGLPVDPASFHSGGLLDKIFLTDKIPGH